MTNTYFGARALTGFQGSSDGGRTSAQARPKSGRGRRGARAQPRERAPQHEPRGARRRASTRVRRCPLRASSSSASIRSSTSWKASRRPGTTSSHEQRARGARPPEEARAEAGRPARWTGRPTRESASVRPPRARAGPARRRRSRATSRRGGTARRETPRRPRRREERSRISCVPWQGTPGRRACARARPSAPASPSCSIRVWVGSPGTFSTRKCRSASAAICGRCVIVITCARSARRWSTRPTALRGLAADPGVDLVEDERLAARDRRDREGDARELAAGRGLGDRPERQARVRADEEHRLVAARRAGLALVELAHELALAHADVVQLRGDRIGERGRRGAPLGAQLVGERVRPRLGRARAPRPRPQRDRRRRRAPRARRAPPRPARAAPRRSRSGSGASRRRSGRARPRAPRAVLARPRATRGSACSSEAVSRSRSSTSRSSSPARCELGCEALERRDGPLGERDEARGAVALLGRQRLRRGRRSLGELGDVPEPLAVGAQLVLLARLEALGVLDERAELVEPRLRERGVRRSAPRGGGAPPGARATPRAPRPGASAAPRRRTGRAPRAGTTAGRAGAARTAPTSR